MQTHQEIITKLIQRDGVRNEVERIEQDEGALQDTLLKVRQQADTAQAAEYGASTANRHSASNGLRTPFPPLFKTCV